jgi:hypothetical protein
MRSSRFISARSVTSAGDFPSFPTLEPGRDLEHFETLPDPAQMVLVCPGELNGR